MKNYDSKMVPGTTVKLSGKFLKNTGQHLGHAGLDRWVVQECPCSGCKNGQLVATNEEKSADALSMFTKEELRDMPYLKMRHIARANLVIFGTISSRNCA